MKNSLIGFFGASLLCFSVGAMAFAWGNCTWGVAKVKGEPVKNSKGEVIDYKLPWTGDAKDWCTKAANAGVSISSTPTDGAIVVFPGWSGNSYGHVGILTYYDSKNSQWQMESMNDLPAGNALNVWTYNRVVNTFPNKAKPVTPSCYIPYKTEKK